MVSGELRHPIPPAASPLQLRSYIPTRLAEYEPVCSHLTPHTPPSPSTLYLRCASLHNPDFSARSPAHPRLVSSRLPFPPAPTHKHQPSNPSPALTPRTPRLTPSIPCPAPRGKEAERGAHGRHRNGHCSQTTHITVYDWSYLRRLAPKTRRRSHRSNMGCVSLSSLNLALTAVNPSARENTIYGEEDAAVVVLYWLARAVNVFPFRSRFLMVLLMCICSHQEHLISTQTESARHA